MLAHGALFVLSLQTRGDKSLSGIAVLFDCFLGQLKHGGLVVFWGLWEKIVTFINLNKNVIRYNI